MDPNILLAMLLFSETKDIEDAKGIANVVINRMKRPERFGSTLEEVIYKPSQFSGVNSTEWKKTETGEMTDKEKDIFKQFIAISSAANKGALEDNTKGADHYVNLKIAKPKFSKVYPKTAQLGEHTYFVEPVK
jgi:spore germination cell wall hydrolase CwlJ-like protein